MQYHYSTLVDGRDYVELSTVDLVHLNESTQRQCVEEQVAGSKQQSPVCARVFLEELRGDGLGNWVRCNMTGRRDDLRDETGPWNMQLADHVRSVVASAITYSPP